MSYLDDVASQIEALVPYELVPTGDGTRALFRLYAVLALAKGRAVTEADVHNAWAAWMQDRDPQHRALKPVAELDAATRASDEPFVMAIRGVAARFEK